MPTSLKDAMNCSIPAHDCHSSNNGSIERDLCKQPHGDHERGIGNTYQRAKLGLGDRAMLGLVTPDGVDHVMAAPLAISRWPPPHTPRSTDPVVQPGMSSC
jgi:hypothetical protein